MGRRTPAPFMQLRLCLKAFWSHLSCLLRGTGDGNVSTPSLAPASPLCLPPQVVYYSEMHKIFGDLTQQLDQPGHSDEQREQENEAKLSELRALSIVADD